jgi:hypothetical protein
MNREDLLAAMYDDDAPDMPTIPIDNGISRRIRVGVIEYEVPTVDYVRRLEQIILQQAQTLEQQRRTINRIEGMLMGTRNYLRRHGDALSDLRYDMARKVDQHA